MDNMPDFDSMTPEEMMAWMEALAKRQGATEGLVTAGDMEVPEIDPDTVGVIDEPGYIPFGMDPEVWAQKKAKEDAARAERIAAMKADKADREKSASLPAAGIPDELPVAASSPLDFLADMSGISDSPDTSPYLPVEEPEAVAFSAEPVAEVPLDDLFADLSGAVVPESSGDMDWLADLGQSSVDLPNFDSLDFGSFDALDTPAAQGENNPLEWLESLVGSGDSDKLNAIADDEVDAGAEAVAALDEMLIEGDDILEDSAVSAVLNDPMEWLADFSDTQPMESMAADQAANSREVLAMSDDLDAFFDRIQTADEGESLADFDLNRPMGELVDSGLMDFGGTPDFDESDEVNIGSALTQGSEVPPEDVKAWMDSLLDRGISRTDVTDEDEDAELEAEVLAELPSWLVEQVGEPPSQELLSASGDDLPDWLTAPVSDSQNAEFEEMFSQMSSGVTEAEPEQALPEFDTDVAPLDTGVIRVQMNDPWVEAFELERDERLSDTGRLAAWYESAAHEVQAAQRHSDENPVVPAAVPAPSMSSLKSAQLPADDELPHGEPQAVPTWLGGAEPVQPVVVPATDTIEPSHSSEEELPDWLRAAQLESDEMAEVPTWLTDSLSTDEFEILQLGNQPDAKSNAELQDEPTSPVPVQQSGPLLTETAKPTPISQRPTSELPRVASARAAREIVAPHEAVNVINQARASQKMGELNAMLDAYERLVRSEVALEEVEIDMEKVAKDPVHKTNPSVLRVYGDVLLRRGKLQQALDTYRAALNLL